MIKTVHGALVLAILMLAMAFGMPYGSWPGRSSVGYGYGYAPTWNRGWVRSADPIFNGASLSGQILCRKESPPKGDEQLWHRGDQYGPKYAGMFCIGPLE